MRSPEHFVLREHDCKLHFLASDPGDSTLTKLRNEVVRYMRRRGWKIGLDPHTRKHYPCLSKDHHRGIRHGLEVKIQRSGRSLEFAFFQNVVRENPHGGEFDFNRRQKMPHLIGLRYELARRHLVEIFSSHGYPFEPARPFRGIDAIRDAQAELADFHRCDWVRAPRSPYNVRSAAGREIRDGDVVYFRDNWRGRVGRGIAHYHINNMWYVLLASGEVRNEACFRLYHREDFTEPLKGRRVLPRLARDRLKQRKQEAVAAERYERAARMRDALARFPEVA